MKQHTIIFALGMALFIGVGIFALLYSDSITETQNRNKRDFSLPAVQAWKEYENTEADIAFRYPDIFQGVDIRVLPGQTGFQLSGRLIISPDYSFHIGGVSKNYTAPQGGDMYGTYGYEKRGEKYFIQYIWNDYEIISPDFWEINEGKDLALVVRDTEIEQILSAEATVVLVNTKSSVFPGFILSLVHQPPFTHKLTKEEETEMFKYIVSLFSFDV